MKGSAKRHQALSKTSPLLVGLLFACVGCNATASRDDVLVNLISDDLALAAVPTADRAIEASARSPRRKCPGEDSFAFDVAGSQAFGVWNDPTLSGRWVDPLPKATEEDLEPLTFARQGFYIGGGGIIGDVEGDFDGDTIVVSEDNPSDISVIPDIDIDGGFEAVAGWRGKRYGLEVGYERIVHDGEFLGVSGDDTFQVLNIDFRQYFWNKRRLSPFLLVGFCVLWTSIEDGATDGVNVKDADLEGLGVNLGGGFTYNLTSRLAIYAKGIYRFGEYYRVDGFGPELDLRDDLDAPAWNVGGGLIFTLNSRSRGSGLF